jgi:thioredoxin reductase (NADPH)
MEIYDILIIGAGPIGLYSAYLSSVRNLKGLVIEKTANYGGQLKSVYPEKIIHDIPSIKGIKANDFADGLYNQYAIYSETFPIHYEETILSVIKENDYYILTTSKQTYTTKVILVCSGNGENIPNKLELENVDNKVLYAVTNVEKFINKDIIVLGGGDSALDVANMLVKNAKSLTLIHRRSEFRAQESSLNLLKQSQGKIITNAIPTAITIEEGAHYLYIPNDKIYFDYIIVNYGFKQNASIFSQLVNVDKFGITIKTNMESSSYNIFAVGNACSYYGKVKTLACGFGEANTAIIAIHQRLFPDKNPIIYTSTKS